MHAPLPSQPVTTPSGERFQLAKTLVVPSEQNQKSAGSSADDEVDPVPYVCNIAVSPTLPLTAQVSGTKEVIAVSDSTNSIYLLSRQTLDVIGRISGHTDTITQIAFERNNAAILWSSSHDGSIRCWDLRTQQVGTTLLGTDFQQKITQDT